MEFESTEKLQMVYETLNNIETAIIRLQERTVQIHTVDDFLLSPFGMEKLDAACMVIIALGEAVKTLDKLTHHHHHADEVFTIVKNDLEPLRKAIDLFKEQLFGTDKQ